MTYKDGDPHNVPRRTLAQNTEGAKLEHGQRVGGAVIVSISPRYYALRAIEGHIEYYPRKEVEDLASTP